MNDDKTFADKTFTAMMNGMQLPGLADLKVKMPSQYQPRDFPLSVYGSVYYGVDYYGVDYAKPKKPIDELRDAIRGMLAKPPAAPAPAQRTRRAAVHEAGHAVMCELVGAPVVSVSILSPDLAMTFFSLKCEDPEEYKAKLAVAACAGVAAEFIFGYRSRAECVDAMNDRNFADAAAVAHLSPEDRAGTLAGVIYALDTGARRGAIKRVAEALVKADLTGDGFRVLMGEP